MPQPNIKTEPVKTLIEGIMQRQMVRIRYQKEKEEVKRKHTQELKAKIDVQKERDGLENDVIEEDSYEEQTDEELGSSEGTNESEDEMNEIDTERSR